MYKITVGAWRNHTAKDPMQVVSGAMGRRKYILWHRMPIVWKKEMQRFIHWFNEDRQMDPVLKAAVAHLWFVTICAVLSMMAMVGLPEAIADCQLSRADQSALRFYSMSAQIRKERTAYYDILESTQKGSMDITKWLTWFLQCLGRSLDASQEILATVLHKARFWEKHATTI